MGKAFSTTTTGMSILELVIAMAAMTAVFGFATPHLVQTFETRDRARSWVLVTKLEKDLKLALTSVKSLRATLKHPANSALRSCLVATTGACQQTPGTPFVAYARDPTAAAQDAGAIRPITGGYWIKESRTSQEGIWCDVNAASRENDPCHIEITTTFTPICNQGTDQICQRAERVIFHYQIKLNLPTGGSLIAQSGNIHRRIGANYTGAGENVCEEVAGVSAADALKPNYAYMISFNAEATPERRCSKVDTGQARDITGLATGVTCNPLTEYLKGYDSTGNPICITTSFQVRPAIVGGQR